MFGEYETRRYPGARVRRIRRLPFYGIGDDAVAPLAPSPAAPAVDPADARKMHDVGKGVFVGTAYGIALGMILSEFVLRKGDAGAQLKQNHQLVMYGALFGAAVGGVGAVQAQEMQA